MKKLLILILFAFSMTALHAQSIDELKRTMKKAQQEIDRGNRLLKVNKTKSSNIVNDIVITSRNIRNRENIISSGKKHSTLIRRDINTNNTQKNALTKQLNKEKDLYVKMMRSAYKRNLQNQNLYFLLSSSSFHNLYLRIYYLNKYSQMKIKLAEKIEKDNAEISAIVNNLTVKRTQLDNQNKKITQEVAKLSNERLALNAMHKNINSENKNIIKTVNNNVRKMSKIKKQIAKIIEEENKAYSKKSKSEKDIYLSKDFVQNKGKLPRPVDGGLIIEKFGTHRHPLYPTIMVDNRGVNIAVDNNTTVKAVFRGVVTRVFFIQGLNNSVMVRHGDYITVYSGITVVNVKKDDVIDTGDLLGKISNTTETPMLHFELHKGKIAQNPEIWIRK